MFDATRGQQAADTRLEDLSNQLAADAVAFLADPSTPRARKEAALAAAANIFANPDQLNQLAQGTYAQNNAGQPAAALGAGTDAAQPTITPQQAVQAIMDNRSVNSGIKLAIRRLLTPGDPEHIQVDDRGTWTALVDTEVERDAALDALANERNPRHHGSLAQQLAAVTAERDAARAERDAARAAAGGYDQTTARQRLGEVDEAIDDLVGKMGGRVEGRNELKQKLNTLLSIIHLSRA